MLWRKRRQTQTQDTDLYSRPDHFVDFKNPEILASAFNHHELLIRDALNTRAAARDYCKQFFHPFIPL